jgi:hypothetical protein
MKLNLSLYIIYITILFISCKREHNNKVNNNDVVPENKIRDRWIGVVKTDSIITYLKEIKGVVYIDNNKYLEVYILNNSTQKIKDFNQQILNGNNIDSIVSYTRANKSKFADKFNKISEDGKYGFKAKKEIIDNISVVYIPYEIIVAINKRTR